jgi:peptidoglycan/LPS O-acetylase OafA/YrhL
MTRTHKRGLESARPAGPIQRIGRLPNLDGIRGIAFLIVICSHAGLPRIMPGSIALSAFFLLSGYLVTLLLLREWDTSGSISITGFYRRRAFRILPPMYICLAVAAALSALGLIPGELRLTPILSQIFCVNNYYMIFADPTHTGMPEGTSIFWYVALQEQFYLVYPIVLLYLLRRVSKSSCAAIFAALIAAALLWRYTLIRHYGVTNSFRTFTASDTRFDAILFGCILALYRNPATSPIEIGRRYVEYAILLGCASVLLITSVVNTFEWRETLRYTLQSMALVPVVYLAITDADSRIFRWLEWRALRLIGTLSYTLYLIHYVALFLVGGFLPAAGIYARAAVAFVISLAFAYAMHLWVEEPLDRWRKRLGVRPQALRQAETG